MITLADALVHRYPAAFGRLREARITPRHAQLLVETLDEAEPEIREALLPDALALAESEAAGTFRRSLRRLVESARSVTLAERHAAAVLRRRMVVENDADGMSWLHVYAPSVELRSIHHRLTSLAKAIVSAECDDRTLDQARVDVLSDLLIDGEMASHPPEVRGIRATVVVTVPALALLCHDDATREEAALAPAIVEGLGPIPIERARELCGTATGMMRVLTHPETGVVLSVGRTRYRPPPELRDLVRWRASRCMAPGCGMPAERCDIDHNVAWEHGGETSATNLCPLCRGHHLVKHHGGWRLTPLGDGSVEWTSPAGRRYVVAPERRMPVFRPSHAGDAPF